MNTFRNAPDCGLFVFVFADRRVEVRWVLRPAGEIEEKPGVPIKMSASA